MADLALEGLEPVTDPDLIATLEQSQDKINAGTGGEGKPLPAWAAKPFEQQLGNYALIAGAANTFQDDYAGNTVTGGLENWLQGKVGVGTPGQRDWWAQFKQADNKIRNELFGATLTPSEQQAYAATSIEPGMKPSEVRTNLKSRREIIRKALTRKAAFLRAQGYNEEAISALAGEFAGDFAPEKVKEAQDAGEIDPLAPGGDDLKTTDIEFGPGGDSGPQSWPPEKAAAYDQFWKGNPDATLSEFRAFMGGLFPEATWEPGAFEQFYAAKDKAGAVAPGASGVIKEGLTPEEQAEVDRTVNATGATGATVAGATDTLTMGALDKLGAGVEAFGDAMTGQGSFTDRFGRRLAVNGAVLEGISEDHPWAYASGQVAGGLVLPVFGARTAAQLAKVGAAYGAAYGTGSSDSLAEVPGNAAVGAGIGAAGGWAGGKLVEKLAGRSAAKAATGGGDTSADRYARAQSFNLDPGLDVVGGRGAKIVGNTLSNMPGSAGTMNAARQKLSGQVDEAVEDVAGTFGPSTSFEGMGRAAQAGVRKWQDKFESVAGKAYEAIPISPDAATKLDNTRQALTEMTTIFESNPKMAESFKNMRLERYMEALDPQGAGLSWKDLKQFRSKIGEEVGDQRFSDSPTKTELRRLYAALSEDMRLSAQAQGPEALKKFERANALYREGQQRIDNAVKYLVGDDGTMTAEKAAARIQAMVKSGKASSDLARIAEIRKSLPPEEAGELVNGVVKLLGQPANSAGREFAPETFVRNFKDMAPEAKNLLFGGSNKELRQNLDEFAKVMGDFAERDALRNTSNTAGQLITAAGFYSLGNLPALVGQAVTSYGLARAWTNPRFVRWATGYAKMAKAAEKAVTVDSERVKTQARLLDKLIASDPAIAQDVLPIRDSILRAANDNLGAQASAGDDKE